MIEDGVSPEKPPVDLPVCSKRIAPDNRHDRDWDAPQLASGTKSGYTFALSGVTGTPASTYQAAASPIAANTTGVRLLLLGRGCRGALQRRCAHRLRRNRDPTAVSLVWVKHIEEAEEKSSAFLFFGLLCGGLGPLS
jgi:hypothetical protein